ncbi:excisionase family DNA binding protein [Paenibacillus anaericanus]|uniref:helix-turn-helix domain-containing protein n=1 Tax=Paenibacillus anaericanus TaxID=170367 RepID=UPI002781965D|nr:helix-turn-helix domain-containing protein [Paenibacillus anaericanus]MDQ0091619.1 excisionase family DNA binding protein [Paenibacillus anaericanus]
MTTTDFIQDIKNTIMAEITNDAKVLVDQMYTDRIKRATLSAEEAAEYIGVSKITLYTMVREKQLPSFPVGSASSQRPQIRLRLSTLDKWMEQQELLNMKGAIV